MSLFGKIVKTAVNVAVLPVAIAQDVISAPFESMDDKETFTRTPCILKTIKDDADD